MASKTFKISEVADLLDVHEDTLRNWEKQGLIPPPIRIGTRRDRRYTAEHIKAIQDKGLVTDLASKAANNRRNYEDATKEQLIKELKLLKKQKKFGIVWEEHTEEVVEECRVKAPILLAAKSKAITDEDLDKPTNILIEGDNYHALQVLNYTHAGKVDVIYIDPPYNTGNKDFKFNDDYVDRNDSFRHSKWLSMMAKRLKLAKNLLSSDGVIFISIDDNEQAHVKLLCDEIFGEDKFITSIPRIASFQRSGQESYMNVSHDYVLCYSYASDFHNVVDRKLTNPSKIMSDKNGTYIEGDTKAILAAKSQGYSEGGDYDFVYNGKTYSPIDKHGNRNRWLWTKERMEAAAALGILVETKSTLRMRIYLDKKFEERTNSLVEKSSKLILHTADFMEEKKYSNTAGTQSLGKFNFPDNFSNPKPIKLIKDIVFMSSKKDSIILDFFAGSGTTAQAVMELNEEDDGSRQFILCTNNENGIATDVCYPRVKKVMKGYRFSGGDKKLLLEKELRVSTLKKTGALLDEVDSLKADEKPNFDQFESKVENNRLRLYGVKKGDGFKEGLGGSLQYLKTGFVDIQDIDNVPPKQKIELTHKAGYMIALKEACFFEQQKTDFYQIFSNGKGKFVGVYFKESLEQIEDLEAAILDKGEVRLYIFSHGKGDTFVNAYKPYKNVCVVPIPEPILEIYRMLNGKRQCVISL